MADPSVLSDSLFREGWVITTSSLPIEILRALAAEARSIWHDGLARPAGIGRREGLSLEPEIRGDHIRWVRRDEISPARSAWLAEIDSIRIELNRSLFLGLENFEAQFAVYPPGAFYKRHLDRFQDAGERTISCLLYLNEHWEARDGGALRLHLDNAPLDVLPGLGTMVLFRSETIEHEVLPATRERFSLTAWYRKRSLRDVIDGRGLLK